MPTTVTILIIVLMFMVVAIRIIKRSSKKATPTVEEIVETPNSKSRKTSRNYICPGSTRKGYRYQQINLENDKYLIKRSKIN